MDDTALRRAAGLAAETAHATEAALRPGRETVEALTAAGFPRHFAPREHGGREGTFLDLLDAVALVAEGCPSAAWCAGLWAAHGRFAAHLPPSGRKEVWGGGPDTRIAAALRPVGGRVVPAPGVDGWLLDGRWHCVSGVEDAHWVLLSAREADTPDAGVLILAAPVAEVTIARTWDPVGLRGTGSHAVAAEGLYVPAHRTFPFGVLTAADPERARCHSAPPDLAGGLLFCAPAVGAARRALRTWHEWAAAAPPTTGAAPLDGAYLREVLLRSSAEIDMAALLLREAARRADDEPVTDRAVARNVRDAAIAADTLVAAVERIFRAGGPQARGAAGELTRAWRDVHTVASHGVLRPDAAAARYAAAAVRPPA
jgi:alkylation response protein AidB-like acyl-CoA dehydrogenase